MATKAGNLTSFKSLVASEFNDNVDDEIDEKLNKEFSSKVNIFSKTGGLILYWSEIEKCIYSTKVKNFNDDCEEQGIQVKVFHFLDTMFNWDKYFIVLSFRFSIYNTKYFTRYREHRQKTFACGSCGSSHLLRYNLPSTNLADHADYS